MSRRIEQGDGAQPGQQAEHREELAASEPEMWRSNEERVSTDEELAAADRELQISLQAAPSELQAANAKLQAANAELQAANAELITARNDLQNLFESTDIATVLVDKRLRTRRFTPAAKEIFRLCEGDVGRPITDIASRISNGNLVEEVDAVLRTLQPREVPVQRLEGDERYLMRILPYRTVEDVVDGAVINFARVTDLERAQEHARQRAEELEKIMYTVPAAIWIAHDPDGRTITGNRFGCELLRMQAGENMSKSAAPGEQPTHFSVLENGRMLAPDELPVQRAARGEAVYNCEVELCADDGTVYRLLGSAEPLQGDQGRPRGAVAVFMDITERVRVEEALRSGEARYRTLFQNLGEVINVYELVRDAQGRVVDWVLCDYNLAAARSFDASCAVGKRATEIFGAEVMEPHIETSRRVVAIGQPIREEIHFPASNRHFLSSVFLLDKDTYVTAGVEITDRVRAERSLRESEERLRLAMDAAHLGTWHWNLQTGELEWSLQCKTMFGLDPGEPVSYTRFLELIHEEDRERADRALARVLATKGECDIEYRTVWPDGSTHWLAARGRVYQDESGKPLRMEGIILDIDHHRRAAEVLHQADRQKNQFLAMLGHELRNPLSALRAAAEVIKLTHPDDATLMKIQAILDRQTRHMATLIDGLLDVSRMVRGKIALDKEPLDLSLLVREVLTDRAQDLDGKNLRLELCAEPLWVEGDRVRLAQVVDNLFSNALKFTSGSDSISITTAREQGCAVLIVQDTGAGIEPELLPHIFEPFRQASQPIDRAAGGLGLGLAVVKGVVELHDGAVTAMSGVPGKGAVFRVRLPLST